MDLTNEQQYILEYLNKVDKGKFSINATAGSGKTFISFELMKLFDKKEEQGLYLVFNKLNSQEAKLKKEQLNLSNLDVRTYHSLALKIIRNYWIYYEPNFDKIEIVNTLQITDLKKIPEFKRYSFLRLVDLIKKFNQFCELPPTTKPLNKALTIIAKNIVTNNIRLPINFYIKFAYQILSNPNTNNDLLIDKADYIVIDEFGDLSELDIAFIKQLLPNKLIAIGDKYQNIYHFRTNAFDSFNSVTFDKEFTLTQSFRVPNNLAIDIEKFGKEFLSPTFKFKGTTEPKTVNKQAILVGTNAEIINVLFDFNASHKEYKIKTKVNVKQLIKDLQNVVDFILTNKKIKLNSEYNYLVEYKAEYKKDEFTNGSFFDYLEANDIFQIYGHKSLVKLVRMYNSNRNIFKLILSYLEKNKHSKTTIYILTAYTSKGLEFDKVTISSDLTNHIINVWFNSIKRNFPKRKQLTLDYVLSLSISKALLNLIFVSYTRTTHQIIGDTILLYELKHILLNIIQTLNDKYANKNRELF